MYYIQADTEPVILFRATVEKPYFKPVFPVDPKALFTTPVEESDLRRLKINFFDESSWPAMRTKRTASSSEWKRVINENSLAFDLNGSDYSSKERAFHIDLFANSLSKFDSFYNQNLYPESQLITLGKHPKKYGLPYLSVGLLFFFRGVKYIVEEEIAEGEEEREINWLNADRDFGNATDLFTLASKIETFHKGRETREARYYASLADRCEGYKSLLPSIVMHVEDL